MSAPHLALYYFKACPFCLMVLAAVKRNNIKVEYRNIHEEQEHLDKLLADTGRQTTPCLYIDGEPMFESRDIIAWLDENKERLEKN